MPTGLTGPIYEGDTMTAAQFLLRCARHSSVLAEMRDDPLDAPIPTIIPVSDYYMEAVERAHRDLAEIEALSEEECQNRAQAEYEARLTARAHEQAKKARIATRYAILLTEIQAWTPPTAEHEKLKDYAISQLQTGAEEDGRSYEFPPPVLNPQWREDRLAELRDQVAYATKRLHEQEERARVATEWLTALRASLPPARNQ